MNEAAQTYWDEYWKDEEKPDLVSAWMFGVLPDELAQLVIDGKKTATCSGHVFYELENERLPQVGEYSIILNGAEQPVAMIKIVKVSIVPMNEVSEEFAVEEGDDEKPLAGPGCPCRNHTAPHPPTGRAPPRDGLARGFAGPGRSVNTSCGFGRARRVQRMPAVLLGTGADLAADDGADRLLRALVLEHRLRLGQADLLGRGADAHARLLRPTRTGRWAVASRPAGGAGSGRRAG